MKCSQVAFRDWQVDGGSSGQCAHRQSPEEYQPHISPLNGQPLAGTPRSTLASVSSTCSVATPQGHDVLCKQCMFCSESWESWSVVHVLS